MAGFDQVVGFIGAGNMARAIIRGALSRELLEASHVVVSDANSDQVVRLRKELGVQAAVNNRDLVKRSDVIILATKPHHVAGVMEEVADVLDVSRHLVASICAGVRTEQIEDASGISLRVVRVMPNTPALIGCGSAAIAGGKDATQADLDVISRIFDSVGSSVIVSEEKLDVVTGVSGSGPAYVFRFMEVLLEAAENQGLTSEEAEVLVPQMVLGAARMAVEGERSLAELREAVTTPGGTTAAGLAVLDEGDFSGLINCCVKAATERSRELAKS